MNSRCLMFLASSVWVAVILVVLVFRGGGAVQAPVERPPAEAPVGNPIEQARTLAARGDYLEAWEFYYWALQVAPEDASLWYGLGVALSHLDERAETQKAFQYVVHRGRPDSEEVRVARRWLVMAGVLAEPVVFTAVAEPVDVRGDKAVLQGKAMWEGPERPRSPLRVRILLEGLNGAAEGKRFSTRVVLGQAYRFERLPAGSYRLIGGAAGYRLWDLTLAAEDGKVTLLDLSQENSTNPAVEL